MIDSKQHENNTRPDMIRTNTAENSAMTVVIHTKTTENNAKLDMFNPKQYQIDSKPNMTCAKTAENNAKSDMIRANAAEISAKTVMIHAKTAENCSNPDKIRTRTLENGIRLKKWNLKTIKRKMYLTDGQNPVANKNYISIGVSVRTNNRTARNNGGAARQKRNPQSPTVYSSVRYSAFKRKSPTSLTNFLWQDGHKRYGSSLPLAIVSFW